MEPHQDSPEARGAPYVVIGAGGHATSVAEMITRRGGRVECFVDNAAGRVRGLVIGEDEYAATTRIHRMPAVVAIGANDVRTRLSAQLVSPAPALIAVTATADAAQIGDGTVVLEHAHVGPNTRIGDACIVNTGAIIEHDCTIGDGVHIAPGAVLLGGVKVGDQAFVGANSTVLPGIRVGESSVVGAGSVVTADVEDGATVAGVPARRVR